MADQFARTVNRLKGAVTMLFIAHQLPKALQVDKVYRFGSVPGSGSRDGAYDGCGVADLLQHTDKA